MVDGCNADFLRTNQNKPKPPTTSEFIKNSKNLIERLTIDTKNALSVRGLLISEYGDNFILESVSYCGEVFYNLNFSSSVFINDTILMDALHTINPNFYPFAMTVDGMYFVLDCSKDEYLTFYPGGSELNLLAISFDNFINCFEPLFDDSLPF